jgi:hypothetical protein
MFKDDIDPERFARIVDREVWLRPARVADAGAILSASAAERLDALLGQYPQWMLAADERDEFPYWMRVGDDLRPFIATPRRRRELIAWLTQQRESDHWQDDDWRQRCSNDFATTACALYALAREGTWITDRRREALQAWSEEKLLKLSWRHMGPVLAEAPQLVLKTLAHSDSSWLQAIAKTFEGHEATFFALVRGIIVLDHEDGVVTDKPVMRAINHPVGQRSRRARAVLMAGGSQPAKQKNTIPLWPSEIDKEGVWSPLPLPCVGTGQRQRKPPEVRKPPKARHAASALIASILLHNLEWRHRKARFSSARLKAARHWSMALISQTPSTIFNAGRHANASLHGTREITNIFVILPIYHRFRRRVSTR